MDGLIVLVVIYFVINMVVKSKKAINAQQQGKAPQGSRGSAGTNAGARTPTVRKTAAAPQKDAPAHPAYQPMKPSAAIGEGQSQMHHSLEMRMDNIADSRPRRQEYTGSLGGGSTEGMDTCDPSLGHQDADDSFYAQGSVYENEIGSEFMPQWDANSIVRGVIVSEILQRPAERKWGRA